MSYNTNRAITINIDELLLYLLVIAYPFHFYFNLLPVPVNISYGDLIVAVIGALWLVGYIGTRSLPKYTPLLAIFIVFATVATLLVYILPFVHSDYFHGIHTLIGFLKLFGAISWMIAVFVLLREDTELRILRMTALLVSVAILLSIDSVYSAMIVGELRPRGTFENPNIYGNYLVLNIFFLGVLAEYLWKEGEKGVSLVVVGTGLSILSMGLIVTASRGAIIGLVVGILALATLRVARNPRLVVNPFVIGPSLVTLASITGLLLVNEWVRNRVFSQFFSLSIKNLDTRITRWEYGVDGLASNPLLGVGYGQAPNYIVEAGFEAQYPRLHNTPLTIAVEVGIIGFLIFLLVFLLAARDSYELSNAASVKNLYGWPRSYTAVDYSYALFFGAFILSTFVQGFVTEVQNFRSVWIVMGVLAAMRWSAYDEAVKLADLRQQLMKWRDIRRRRKLQGEQWHRY